MKDTIFNRYWYSSVFSTSINLSYNYKTMCDYMEYNYDCGIVSDPFLHNTKIFCLLALQ